MEHHVSLKKFGWKGREFDSLVEMTKAIESWNDEITTEKDILEISEEIGKTLWLNLSTRENSFTNGEIMHMFECTLMEMVYKIVERKYTGE